VTDGLIRNEGAGQPDIGEYCRQVEDHLARVNEGHLVRVVGVGFELVRQWALAGVPLSVVYRGIERKAERHRAGRSTRPLRIEFCEADVGAMFEEWRRAVGVATAMAGDADVEPEARRPSLTKQLDRIVTALVRAAGRLDTPDALRERLSGLLEEIVQLHEQARHARGPARDGIAGRLVAADRALIATARAALDPAALEALRAEAAAELIAYRGRLDAGQWSRSVEAATDRLVRGRFGLPTLDV
jgi:hypothetical protein